MAEVSPHVLADWRSLRLGLEGASRASGKDTRGLTCWRVERSGAVVVLAGRCRSMVRVTEGLGSLGGNLGHGLLGRGRY